MTRFELRNQHGEVLARSDSYERLEKKMQSLLNWRCGICGTKWAGWRKCSHGTQHQVCSAEHYNDRIVQVC